MDEVRCNELNRMIVGALVHRFGSQLERLFSLDPIMGTLLHLDDFRWSQGKGEEINGHELVSYLNLLKAEQDNRLQNDLLALIVQAPPSKPTLGDES